MTRWIWVIAISAFVAFALRPIFTKEFHVPEGVEESRMFWLEGPTTVRFVVPQKTSFVELHVVSVIEPRPRYDPGAEHPFAMDAALRGSGDEDLFRWDLFAASRVSFERFPPIGDDARGAKLVGSRDWVTDNRVITLPVQSLVADTNGTLTVRAKGDHRLLVRAFAVRGGQRVRLTVEGARGRDYELRRVVLSKFRRLRERGGQRVLPEPLGLEPGQSVVLNLTREADLWIEGHANCTVYVTDGIHHGRGRERTPLAVRSRERSLISVTDLGTRSLALAADEPCRFRVLADQASAASILGAKVTPFDASLFVVEPDIRDSTWYLLDWRRPLRSRVEEGEQRLEVSLRKIADEPTAAREGTVKARIETVLASGKVTRREVSVERRWSRYESMDGFAASASHTVRLRLPPDAVEVAIFGDADVAARLAVPTGLNNEIAPPYDAELPAGRRWFGAPQISKRVRTILATNEEELDRERRIRTLRYQPRVVGGADEGEGEGGGRAKRRRRGAGGADDGRGRRGAGPVVPLVLRPEGSPPEHRVFLRPEDPIRARGATWARIAERGTDVQVSAAGGGWITVAWRVPASALGGNITLRVDGVEFGTWKASTSVQEARVRVAPGPHHVEVLGLPSGGLAFADARAVSPLLRFEKKGAHLLLKGEALAFRVPEEETGSVTVLLQVFAQRAGDTWVIPYNVFVNEGEDRHARFVTNATVQGAGTRERSPVIWEVTDGGAALLETVRLRLDAPDSPALRSVRLRLAGGTAAKVWVRAVLLSRSGAVKSLERDEPKLLRRTDR